jgi:hypothetical protein
MSQYDNKVKLWVNKNDNPKAPKLKGKGNFEGKDFNISLWPPKDWEGDLPELSGSVQKPWVKPENNDQEMPF